MVCPWVQNGNLNKYLENRGPALNVVDRFRIASTLQCLGSHGPTADSFGQLRGVACGISYRTLPFFPHHAPYFLNAMAQSTRTPSSTEI